MSGIIFNYIQHQVWFIEKKRKSTLHEILLIYMLFLSCLSCQSCLLFLLSGSVESILLHRHPDSGLCCWGGLLLWYSTWRYTAFLCSLFWPLFTQNACEIAMFTCRKLIIWHLCTHETKIWRPFNVRLFFNVPVFRCESVHCFHFLPLWLLILFLFLHQVCSSV